MSLKTLKLAADLREFIPYDTNTLPLAVFSGSFDDYAGMEWSCHWHDEFEIILVRNGTVKITTYEGLGNPTTFELMEGDIALINSGVLHSIKAFETNTIGSGFVLPISFFDFRSLQSIGARILQPITESGMSYLIISRKEEHSAELIAAINELCAVNEEHPSRELLCIELVCRIWRLLSDHMLTMQRNAPSARQSLTETRVKQMVSYIHEHFHEHIAADDLAKHAHISRTECFKSFNEVLKKTPVEYLNEYRLSTAAMLLTYSERNITEIALSCGFSDTSYFAKMFRRMHGMPPKQYRNKANGTSDQT